MIYELFSTLETEVRRELEMFDEDIVSQAGMIAFANDAIRIAEGEIMKMNEDYYKTKDYVALVNGQSEYSMPTNIYANKLRGVVYRSGTTVYSVKRMKGQEMFEDIAEAEAYGNTALDYYKYDIENASASAGIRFVLYPPARETSSTVMRRWYIRRAARVSAVSDPIDVPEGYEFVKSYVKDACKQKELGAESFQMSADTRAALANMISVLSDIVPDGDNELELDTTIYEEMS